MKKKLKLEQNFKRIKKPALIIANTIKPFKIQQQVTLDLESTLSTQEGS